MNTHLNLFKTYTKEDREYQLENDLTRAFAITLLEDNLLLHEILKHIFKAKKGYYSKLFDDFSGKSNIKIDIQKRVTDLNEFDHLFAVSLSQYEMDVNSFFNHNGHQQDLITDMIISIDDIVIIFEVKPNNHNCTAQLYNQAYNAFNQSVSKDTVTPVDLNWKTLMDIVLKVSNFEKAINKPSRFVGDFIQLIQKHNYTWLPQMQLNAINFKGNENKISDRIIAAITNSNFNGLSDRLGFQFNLPWANEVLFRFNEFTENIETTIYPGNTKGQGYHLFQNENGPNFKREVTLLNAKFPVVKNIHIKFTSFQKYFEGIWAKESDFKQPLMTRHNFLNHSGRKKRGDNNWSEIENLFDTHFKPEFNWKDKCNWKRTLESGKSQFDISFGYELRIDIPYKKVQQIDTNKNDLQPLVSFLENVNEEFKNVLIK